MMNEHVAEQRRATGPASRWGRRWHWQAILAAILALLAVQGEPATASYAKSEPGVRLGAAGRAAGQVERASTRIVVRGADGAAAVERPDLRLTFAGLDVTPSGGPVSATLHVFNDGDAAAVASVSAVLPPELSNVRVTAPGFVCTRQFAASGPQAGTTVSCTRNDLEGGATAEVTIEANAPRAGGAYRLTAVVDPRDEVDEADEANNAADAVVTVLG